jgi:hypothetical protein
MFPEEKYDGDDITVELHLGKNRFSIGEPNFFAHVFTRGCPLILVENPRI